MCPLPLQLSQLIYPIPLKFTIVTYRKILRTVAKGENTSSSRLISNLLLLWHRRNCFMLPVKWRSCSETQLIVTTRKYVQLTKHLTSPEDFDFPTAFAGGCNHNFWVKFGLNNTIKLASILYAIKYDVLFTMCSVESEIRWPGTN